ncbi:hypothetical protein MUK42_18314 [Musa troglodytarum]|uniref:Uncharacterized protein n=1 Tax=Musa troglodytarum TaxID=320322 RepID=A0A9E7KQ38_9LILI|nr:hypothetical protein MUK42_18314 [Musa troglodytarum]
MFIAINVKGNAATGDRFVQNFVGTKENSISREALRTHQRTASESFLLEEQPSWLDDLLDESEMPVRKASHRRSSSDSFAFLDASSISWNGDSLAQDDHKYRTSAAVPSWRPQEFDYLKDMQLASYYADANSTGGTRSRGLEFGKKMATYPSNSLPSSKDKLVLPGSSSATKKSDALSSTLMEGQVKEECSQDQVGSSDTKEGPQAKHSQSEMEARRAKQLSYDPYISHACDIFIFKKHSCSCQFRLVQKKITACARAMPNFQCLYGPKSWCLGLALPRLTLVPRRFTRLLGGITDMVWAVLFVKLVVPDVWDSK